MDIKIPNSWLKKYLDTKASPSEIAKYLSLCGPSIEKVEKVKDGDSVYSIEVTTNRVDSASVLGIAREAVAILPRFGISATFKNKKLKKERFKFVKKVKYLEVVVDSKLCPRFTAVLIKDVKIKDSPQDIKSLLEKVDVRPINNIVDVSNFIMHELGQPVHTFDFDKIVGGKMILRESKKSEVIKTLDEKEFKLDGGDIVIANPKGFGMSSDAIEDGEGKLIDLCGIMGGQNSAVDNNTKNVLLFVQNYDKHKIRKTSMNLGQRTEAAVLFEKGLDSENVKPAIILAVSMIEKLSGGKSEEEILDIYPSPYKIKNVSVAKEEIDKIIGIDIPEKEIKSYLTNLGFEVKTNKKTLEIKVPSYRADDINIKEDIIEEIARIYGYHNLPCLLMDGSLPKPKVNNEFKFENNLKVILRALGGTEIYNSSLVSKEMTSDNALGLKNPLGTDTELLRTSLRESLIQNIKDNPQEKGRLHIFEIANVYIPIKNSLPQEKLTLAGIIKNGNSSLVSGSAQILDFRKNKGIVEKLLEELNISYIEKIEEGGKYLPNQRLSVYSGNTEVGEYGNLEVGYFYYTFDLQKLMDAKKISRKYKSIPKFPPQVEDLTLIIPEKTYIGDVIDSIKSVNQLVNKVELTDTYKNNYTVNIEYQSPDHTLTDKEVESIRVKILSSLKSKFGITV
ncbi:MAG: phenylalanine--tRNA ligase subunit beta [bacterium]|nr:MAG: phenylalanine--tRNA ligase subunit beta [bacterium]